MDNKKTIIGIIGCGVISNTYIRDIKRLYSDIEIAAVADIDMPKALSVAKQYDIKRACEVEELLAIPEISIVVNLTSPASHTKVNKMILNSGKNVFCEKPLALTLDEAKGVVELADEKGLRVCCAPDSFLGSSLSSCIKYLNDGMIGKPLYVNTNMLNSGVETWHPRPEAFYRFGGGPIFDMGGYYFTTLVEMFGSVSSVRAVGGIGFKERTVYTGERAGEKFKVEVPTHYAVLVKFKSGILANMNFSFDIFYSDMPMFEVYGTEGTLIVPDPNMHGGTPRIFRKEQKLAECFGGVDEHEGKPYDLPEISQNVGTYVRGIGVHEMACAIKENREPKANGRLAIHVVDIMTSVIKSAEINSSVMLTTEYVTD